MNAVAQRLLSPLRFADGRGLPSGLIPGPMDGVSEGSFVGALSGRGYVPCWHCPFIRVSTGVASWGKLSAHIRPYLSTGLPLIAQVMGGHGGRLAETARRLHGLGAVCVDLNCGCPSPTVLGNGSGGAKLKELGWLSDTLGQMRESCGSHGLSVKVRIGYESPDEFPGIAGVLRSSGVDMVTVHFRTVREMYRRVEGGLDRLREAVRLLEGIPVIGSGDLFTVEDCIRMAEETGVRGVAPARGMLKDPRLLLKLKARLEGKSDLEVLDWVGYLLELAEHSNLRPGGSNGFVLRIAHAMFGKDSDVFRRLAACRTLADTIARLHEWHTKGVREDGRTEG